MDKDL